MSNLKSFPGNIPSQVRRLGRLTAGLTLCGSILLSGCAIEQPWISAPHYTLQQVVSAPTDPVVDTFVDELAVALAERDFAHLQGMMANPFSIMKWQAQTLERPSAVALLTMRDRYLGAGSAIAFREGSALSAGHPEFILPIRSDSSDVVRALYIVGLGMEQRDEALLFIARHADGTPYWHSILLADGGFPVVAKDATDAVASDNTSDTLSDALTVQPEQQFLLELRNTSGETIAGATMLPQVQFSTDALSATIRGVIQPVEERTYLLEPLATGELHFALRSVSPVVSFSVTGVTDGQIYKSLEDSAPLWQGSLPATQEYLVTVTTAVAQPFELAITMASDTLATTPNADAMAVETVASVETP